MKFEKRMLGEMQRDYTYKVREYEDRLRDIHREKEEYANELSELKSMNGALLGELEHVKDNFTQILWIKNAEIMELRKMKGVSS